MLDSGSVKELQPKAALTALQRPMLRIAIPYGLLSTRQLRKHCGLDGEGKGLLQVAMDDLGLSARAHDRILRVARTIADLEGSDSIKSAQLVEAIGYRSLDRKLWAR